MVTTISVTSLEVNKVLAGLTENDTKVAENIYNFSQAMLYTIPKEVSQKNYIHSFWMLLNVVLISESILSVAALFSLLASP